MKYYLFIDDTNFEKNKKSSVLNSEKISMVGFLLPEDKFMPVAYDLRDSLEELKTEYNADEFHFTDIYNRKHDFQGINSDDVLSMIACFSDIVDYHDLKFVVQTINDKNYSKIQEFTDETFLNQMKELGFPINNQNNIYEEYALMMCIARAEKYIKNLDSKNTLIQVYCDEGLLEKGKKIILQNAEKLNLPLYFEPSKDLPYLQIADFGAWALSRTKNTLDKASGTQMKEFEQKVMSLLEPLAKRYVNIQTISENVESGIDYDQMYKNLTNEKTQNQQKNIEK